MIFHASPLDGAWVIEPEFTTDERGAFARVFCTRDFEERGLESSFVQTSISINSRCGTLRGMHFQARPHAETKLVRCTRGRLFDVILDLRETSATFCHWFGIELSADNRQTLYVPRGFAHGFVTLADDTEVLYQIDTFYEPTAARGVRWNDPAFGIQWPIEPLVTSARDGSYPDFNRTLVGQ